MGIMVPMVGDAAQAEMIVQSAKYPPLGQRGAAFHMAHDGYAGGDVLEKMRSANDEVVLIAQIENRSGLENVERIAAVDGIDILWIGQFDLSNFLGIPGQFTHPTFLDAIKRVTEACQRYGKTAAFMVPSVEEGLERMRQGFRCVAYWGDLWIYQQGLKQESQRLKTVRAPRDAPLRFDAATPCVNLRSTSSCIENGAAMLAGRPTMASGLGKKRLSWASRSVFTTRTTAASTPPIAAVPLFPCRPAALMEASVGR